MEKKNLNNSVSIQYKCMKILNVQHNSEMIKYYGVQVTVLKYFL